MPLLAALALLTALFTTLTGAAAIRLITLRTVVPPPFSRPFPQGIDPAGELPGAIERLRLRIGT